MNHQNKQIWLNSLFWKSYLWPHENVLWRFSQLWKTKQGFWRKTTWSLKERTKKAEEHKIPYILEQDFKIYFSIFKQDLNFALFSLKKKKKIAEYNESTS